MAIRYFRKYIIVVISVIVIIGGNQMKCSSGNNINLSLSITSTCAFGKNKTEFAIGEPIWVTVSLMNMGNEDITVFIGGDKYRGISIEPESKDRDKVKILPRTVAIDNWLTKIVLKPNEKIDFEILLNEYIQITELGNFQFNFIMQLDDINMNSLSLSTTCAIKISERLDIEAIKKIIKCLESQFESEAVSERLKAIRSIQAIKHIQTIPLLDKAVVDEDEDVQLAAINVLSSLEYEEATLVLKKAFSYGKDPTKRAAKIELDRRENKGIKK